MVSASEAFMRRILNGVNLMLVVALVVITLRLGLSPHTTVASSPATAKDTGAISAARSRDVEDATVVLALATDCSYCEQSLPFYQALLATRPFGRFRAVAIFPEPVSLATEYLRARELSPDEIRQANLLNIGVIGTPTVMVLGATGSVRKSWPGLLSPDAQLEIVDTLGIREPFVAAVRAINRRKQYQDAMRAQSISTEQLTEMLSNGDHVLIVDTRERNAFHSKHIAGAVNIPLDELSVRASIELPKNQMAVVFCQYDQECEERFRERKALTYCSLAASMLFRSGVSQVGVLTADLDQLRTTSVPLASSAGFRLPRVVVTKELAQP